MPNTTTNDGPLERPTGAWPAWARAALYTILVLLQLLAGLSCLYFASVMTGVNDSMASVKGSIEKLGAKVETNTEAVGELNLRLQKFELVDRRLGDLEKDRDDHEGRLRALERAPR